MIQDGSPGPFPAEPQQNQPVAACAACGKTLRPGARFCGKCGAPFESRPPAPAPAACRACGTPLQLDERFCSKCGTPMVPPPPDDRAGVVPASPPPPPPAPRPSIPTVQDARPAPLSFPPPPPAYYPPAPVPPPVSMMYAHPQRRHTGRTIAIIGVSVIVVAWIVGFVGYRAGWFWKSPFGPFDPMKQSSAPSGKYADFANFLEGMSSTMEKFNTQMDSATSASDAESALNTLAAEMEDLKPLIKSMDSKYPELRNPDNLPPELKALKDKMDAQSMKYGSSLQKASQFASDPAVRAALDKVQSGMN